MDHAETRRPVERDLRLRIETQAQAIRIAEQVVEEGVIAVDDESALRPGMAMKAVAVPLPSGDVFDCRFVPAEVAR